MRREKDRLALTNTSADQEHSGQSHLSQGHGHVVEPLADPPRGDHNDSRNDDPIDQEERPSRGKLVVIASSCCAHRNMQRMKLTRR